MSTVATVVAILVLLNRDQQESLRLEQTLQTRARSICMAYSPNGDLLAVGTRVMRVAPEHWKGNLQVWDASTYVKITDIEQPQWVNSVSFSPNGRRLAVGLGSWNDTGLPDNRAEFTQRPGELRLYDTKQFKLMRTIVVPTRVAAVTYSPNSKLLAVSFGIDPCKPGTVDLYDTETWQTIASLTGQQGTVRAMMFSPDSNILAAGDGRKGGSHFCLSGGPEREGPGEVYLWSTVKPNGFRKLTGPLGAIRSLSFSADGKSLAVGTWTRARVFDVDSGEMNKTIQPASFFHNSVAFSPTGQFLAVSSNSQGQPDRMDVSVWDVNTGDKLSSSQLWAGIVLFSPDGRLTVCGRGGVGIYESPEKKHK